MILKFFILCSHIFGTVSDPRDSDGSQDAAADDVEDEYEIVRRQRSAKRARMQTSEQV
jgi:hypothetical protein